MEALVFLAIIFVGIYYFFSRPAQAYTQESHTRNKTNYTYENNADWLQERWQLAEQARITSDYSVIPSWFFDDITNRQQAKLDSLGLDPKLADGLKGKASDLIGLFSPIEDYPRDVMRFFKTKQLHKNESFGRHQVAILMANEENLAKWENRPASQAQKGFFRFFDITAPKGINHKQAEALIDSHICKWDETNDDRHKDWSAFENFWDELSDADIRSEYEISRVSFSIFLKAAISIQRDKSGLAQIEGDLDALIARCEELKPGIRK